MEGRIARYKLLTLSRAKRRIAARRSYRRLLVLWPTCDGNYSLVCIFSLGGILCEVWKGSFMSCLGRFDFQASSIIRLSASRHFCLVFSPVICLAALKMESVEWRKPFSSSLRPERMISRRYAEMSSGFVIMW